MSSDAIIQVENLIKTYRVYDRGKGVRGALKDLFYRKYREVKAVDEVSFEIKRGAMVGYIGANGAGKSTTIKILCGILFPSSGTVECDGRIPWKDRESHVQRIGAVFGQRSQLWWDLAVGESLRLLGRVYSVPHAEIDPRIDRLAEILGLGTYMNTPVRKLSLGQKMRCELAAALLHEPPVLFLDEPTIGLDVVAKQAIREFLREINRERNVTMILTTHDLKEIEELSDRVLMIDQGKLIYDGTVPDLKQRAVDIVRLQFVMAHTLEGCERLDRLPGQGIEWEPKGVQLTGRLSALAPPRAEVIRQVLDVFGADVIDIHIEEPEIEDIVARVYGSEEGRKTVILPK